MQHRHNQPAEHQPEHPGPARIDQPFPQARRRQIARRRMSKIVQAMPQVADMIFVEGVEDDLSPDPQHCRSPDERQRGFGPSAQLPDGAVVLLGGESHTEAHDSVLRFRADGTGAEVLGRLPRPRTLLQAVIARDGRVFLFGGDRAPPGSVAAVTDAAESWTPQGGATPVASLPHPRVGHTATRLRDGRILIVGGENAAGGLLPAALIYE